MRTRPARVVVIGAGITGLTTAWLLRRALGADVDLQLLEARDRVGGNICTLTRKGFVLDEGPDSWLSRRKEVSELASELGLRDQLVSTRLSGRRVYLSRGSRLMPFPDGLVFGVPTRFTPFVTTPLLSWRGKLRAAVDLVAPLHFGRERGPHKDESVGAFLGRRLGREVVHELAGPLTRSIYHGDPDTISMRATMPHLVDCERRGGVIRGSRRLRRAATTPADASPFTSLRGGLGELVASLARALGPIVRTNCAVRSVVRRDDDGARFEVTLGETKESIAASHVVLAGPAHLAAGLTETIDPCLAGELREIPYHSTTVVFLGYRALDVPRPMEGSGYLVHEAGVDEPIASTWVSSKWDGRAPAGAVLIRSMLRGDDWDDARAVRAARVDAERTLGVHAEPIMTHVVRFQRASPQPLVGHIDRIARITERLSAIPGLYVAGSGLHGFGIGDCVAQAHALVDTIVSSRAREGQS